MLKNIAGFLGGSVKNDDIDRYSCSSCGKLVTIIAGKYRRCGFYGAMMQEVSLPKSYDPEVEGVE